MIKVFPEYSKDWGQEGAMGRVPGSSLFRKFAEVKGLSNGVAATVWEYGGIETAARFYKFPTSNSIDTLSSSSVLDTQDVVIFGLKDDFTTERPIYKLDGQNKVPIDPQFRINRIVNASGIPFNGEIFVYEDGDIVGGIPTDKLSVKAYASAGINIASISEIRGNEITLQAVYTTGKNTRTLVKSFEPSILGRKTGNSVQIKGRFREPGGVFITFIAFDLYSDGTSKLQENFDPSYPFIEGTDVTVECLVEGQSVGVSVAWIMVVEDD